MYFPTAKKAKLKDPQSLSLQIVFDGPHFANNHALVPFRREGEHWEALVPLREKGVLYAIFAIKDDQTNAVDDNGGQYWDVVFCNPPGEKSPNGLLSQARSYNGESWPFNIRREKDLAKAISLLETAAAANSNSWPRMMLLTTLWEYKAKRDGDDAAAYAKLAPEIERYLDGHLEDRNTQSWVGNFVVRHAEKLPADFVERTITRLDTQMKDPKHSFRASLASHRAQSEPDPHKRLAALDQVIAQYPGTVRSVYFSRFYTCAELKDVACAETAFAKYREAREQDKDVGDWGLSEECLRMAQLYVEQGVKLDSALKLADEAAGSLGPLRDAANEEYVRRSEADISETRARAYLGLHQYDLALEQAQKALVTFKKRAEAHFVLAQAYAGAGEKTKALDEYFEAALLPSNKDLEYRADLERFYRKNFGNAKRYEAALKQRIGDRFQAAHYVPKLLDQPAPVFEFTTLKGEQFDSAALKGKTTIINFWSPG